jgi:AcrR family transcriptional regulator
VSKSLDRRSELVDRLADHVLAHGLASASLRPLARAAGISDRMLLYYFKDKAEVIAAILECIAARMTVAMSAATGSERLPQEELRQRLSAILFAEALWPYMCVWLEIIGLTARGDPLFRDVGEAIGRNFLAWGAAQLASATPEAAETEAAQLLVNLEGMMVLNSIGLGDVARRSLGRGLIGR